MARAGQRNVFTNSPEVGNPGITFVIVESVERTNSQSFAFEYGCACDLPQFTRTKWKTASSAQVEVARTTAAALYSDGRLYLRSQIGKVFLVT